jgi:putative FmdB family regulatory protein
MPASSIRTMGRRTGNGMTVGILDSNLNYSGCISTQSPWIYGRKALKIMPIFDFECRSCARRFEALVLPRTEAVCPSCQGKDLEKLVSSPAVSTSGTKKMSLTSAQKKNAGTTRDKAWADYEYDRKHRSE